MLDHLLSMLSVNYDAKKQFPVVEDQRWNETVKVSIMTLLLGQLISKFNQTYFSRNKKRLATWSLLYIRPNQMVGELPDLQK